jgi:ribonuclease G
MSKELIVSAGRHETRVAIVEDDQVVELFHERGQEYSLAGSIHKGRVTRVLPGMQSAFVDIGLDRDAFLYVSDFFEDSDEYEAVVSTVEDKVLKLDRGERVDPVAPAESAPPVEPVAEAAAPSTGPVHISGPERREETPRDGRPDRGGDRGRGRRGRRRRGGRGGGLPESKFFSPKGETEAVSPGETAAETGTTPAHVSQTQAHAPHTPERDDDFLVLPGESLAKYSPGDVTGGREDDDSESVEAEDTETAVESNAAELEESSAPELETVREAEASEPPVDNVTEPALPGEHPLAGLGAVSSWAVDDTPPSVERQAPNQHNATSVIEEGSSPAAVAPGSEHAGGKREEALEEQDFHEVPAGAPFLDEEEGLSASEVAEREIAEQVMMAEEEGPEPARIPTSLTATLREQGHRYPHRVSRRMRRKMRGQQPVEIERPAPENVAAPVEAKTVAPREERRPERQDQRTAKERPERERPPLPSISDLLKEGQEIIVQIAKEPLGQKGARITSHIALPGRFVVYMPTVEHVGVSRKIPSDEERQRLKRVLQTHRQGIPGGFICRTAAEAKSEEELKSDMHFLYNLWLDMRQKAEKRPAPVLLHHDLDLVQRVLRDQLTTSFKTIWVDSEDLYESVLRFVQRFQPALVGRVKLYTRANPIFDEFGITAEIEKALRPKVWLKSGGHIVINQTEALVAIDINTGKYVGKSNRLEDTIVKINTDAVKEIVRQIRLRDLGGIIVVDFIDMDERKNRQKVMMALEDAMRADRAPYKILQFNDFGLVAITRKRVKQSLERTLCAPCPYCEGAGYVKSVATVISEVLQEAQRMQKSLEVEHTNIVLRVNPEVARVLKSNHNSFLQEIEEILGKAVLVKSDPLLHQTKFDLA